MLSLAISDTKKFMSHLFKESTFDHFAFRTGELHSFCNFDISAPKGDNKPLWLTIKPYFLSIIKGNATPSSIKIVLNLPPDEAIKLDENGDFFLNIYFSLGKLHITTGTSTKTFSLDRSMGGIWDDHVRDFLSRAGIVFAEVYDED